LASGPTPAGTSDVKAASDSHSAHKERQRFCSSAYAFTHLVCDDLDVDNNATTTTTVLRRAPILLLQKPEVLRWPISGTHAAE
jgi:hypothetical protein